MHQTLLFSFFFFSFFVIFRKFNVFFLSGWSTLFCFFVLLCLVFFYFLFLNLNMQDFSRKGKFLREKLVVEFGWREDTDGWGGLRWLNAVRGGLRWCFVLIFSFFLLFSFYKKKDRRQPLRSCVLICIACFLAFFSHFQSKPAISTQTSSAGSLFYSPALNPM